MAETKLLLVLGKKVVACKRAEVLFAIPGKSEEAGRLACMADASQIHVPAAVSEPSFHVTESRRRLQKVRNTSWKGEIQVPPGPTQARCSMAGCQVLSKCVETVLV